MNTHILACETYLRARTGCYEYRSVRYRAAADALFDLGLHDGHLVVDIGAGWTEFDYHLRTAWDWRGRYLPIDGGLDGIDLETWTPPRKADFYVALEVLEHLADPFRLVRAMQCNVNNGIVVSVPNPRTTDVLGMDETHKTIVTANKLRAHGFKIDECNFYGKHNDSLFAVWR